MQFSLFIIVQGNLAGRRQADYMDVNTGVVGGIRGRVSTTVLWTMLERLEWNETAVRMRLFHSNLLVSHVN